MAKYTLELGDIARRSSVPIFSFDYDFYVDDVSIKSNFEKKFIEHYFIHEIGFETIGRFKNRLKTRLDLNMPKYKQLYESELKARDIEFLLNKDLKETFTRELTNTNSTTGNNTNDTTGTDNTGFKESNLANGNAGLSLESLTSVSDNSNTYTNNVKGNSNINTNGNERETTVLVSQGNIGTTSSAELLQKWRDIMINLDLMIIEDCRDLFMGVY